MSAQPFDREAFEALADRCALTEWDLVLLALDEEELSRGYSVDPVLAGDLAELEALEDAMDFDQADVCAVADAQDYWAAFSAGSDNEWDNDRN